jgi:rhodanese-related sulfurtransferase
MIVLIAAAFSGVACAEEGPGSHIAPEALLELIEAGRAPVIVDVRTLSGYEKGHVPQAIHVSFWAMPWKAAGIPGDREEPVVVYCAHGPRAGIAKAAMRLAGFEHVVYLEGHMTQWQELGLPQQHGPPAD